MDCHSSLSTYSGSRSLSRRATACSGNGLQPSDLRDRLSTFRVVVERQTDATFRDRSDFGRHRGDDDVQRVKRSGNTVAHLCAQFASSSVPSSMWCDQPPSFLLPSLLSDCNLLHV
jgi:hypothetical protein